MKKIGTKFKIIAAVIALVAVVGFMTFDDDNFQIAKNLDVYHTLFRELNLYYVDEVDPGELIKTSIDEMLTSLDPYTVYIPESKMEDYRFMTTGQYGGIGALIRTSGEYVVISEPYEGFPAHKAGLKAGDKVIEIDGKSVKGKDSEDISELLKGEPNTEIKLGIERINSTKPIEIKVVREKIQINSVPYAGMLTENIGYIRLSSFTENCSKEVKKAYQELKKHNELKGLVLDLRGNPGGLLNEAVSISNLFVAKGTEVVSTKGKVKQWNRTYNATDDALDTEIPIAILVNSGSASASEIVSGVFQDLDRGVVMGTRTFGKGLVQTTRDLSYNSKLKLTTAKYYIPSGRCIQALDYTNRNEDGSVGRVPDSLVTEFKTKGGRSVYDGGGVNPDIIIEPQSLSKISISLYTKNLIFDYATQFQFAHDSIAKAEQFEINDAIFKDFTTFIADKEFDYTLDSEKILDDLEKAIEKDKYTDRISNEIDVLRKKLAHDKDKDLDQFKGEIESLLREEIVSRYYFQTGRAKAMITEDTLVDSAIQVLQNQEHYASILKVK